MSLSQIAAIISLLLAFGVDQPTVSNVQGILEASIPTTTVSAPLATTTVLFTPKTEQTFGATINPPQQVSQPIMTTPTSKAEIQVRVEQPSKNFPYYTFWVRVLDNNGVAQLHAPIHVEGKDGSVDKDTNQRQDNQSPWEASISYGYDFPLSEGAQSVTFTSGDLSKTITIGN